jgi:hypothetical protein
MLNKNIYLPKYNIHSIDKKQRLVSEGDLTRSHAERRAEPGWMQLKSRFPSSIVRGYGELTRGPRDALTTVSPTTTGPQTQTRPLRRQGPWDSEWKRGEAWPHTQRNQVRQKGKEAALTYPLNAWPPRKRTGSPAALAPDGSDWESGPPEPSVARGKARACRFHLVKCCILLLLVFPFTAWIVDNNFH